MTLKILLLNQHVNLVSNEEKWSSMAAGHTCNMLLYRDNPLTPDD